MSASGQSVADADTLEACALDATGTWAAIIVVHAALRSRSLHGGIVVIRKQVAAAGTIHALDAGLTVGVEYAGESRG